MLFTYDSYRGFIHNLKEHGYSFASYDNWQEKKQCVILRHDIDNDIEQALRLAKIEKEENVISTYFVLVTSDFYNVFSAKSNRLLKELTECGHTIGLHFDEVRYPEIKSPEDAKEKILLEAKLLETAVGLPINAVSMHRPSKMMLEADLQIPGMINSYGQVYFKGFKYLSDSRKRWREPIDDIVKSEEYKRLHILTHAIWYGETDRDIHDAVEHFVNSGNQARYNAEKENITDLDSIMSIDEVQGY